MSVLLVQVSSGSIPVGASAMYGTRNQRYEVTEDGDRVGPTMRGCLLRLHMDGGVYGSKYALSKTTPGLANAPRTAMSAIKRLRYAGLVEIDDDHPKATPQGQGAVVLTDEGERFCEQVFDD